MKCALIPLIWLPVVIVAIAPLPDLIAKPLQNGEPLWQLAIVNIQSAKSLKATRAEKTITVRDGDETLLGSTESVEIPTLQNGREDWKSISTKKTGDPGLIINMTTFADTAPGGVLDGYGAWAPKGEMLLDGQAVAVWEGLKADTKDKTTAVVCIDPKSALPKRIILDLPLRSLGVTSFKVTLSYGIGPKGAWIPTRTISDIYCKLFFRKRHIVITRLFYDWTERPAA